MMDQTATPAGAVNGEKSFSSPHTAVMVSVDLGGSGRVTDLIDTVALDLSLTLLDATTGTCAIPQPLTVIRRPLRWKSSEFARLRGWDAHCPGAVHRKSSKSAYTAAVNSEPVIAMQVGLRITVPGIASQLFLHGAAFLQVCIRTILHVTYHSWVVRA